jgi:tetratricopeptide (TPR) repeat protein
MVLPDKLVLVFAPNEQSLAGALDAGWQAVQGRKAAPEPKVLPIFPLVSRVEEGEEQQKREWLARVRRSFEQLLSAAYGGMHVDLEAYFNVVRIPHKSYFAYGEHIAATEQAANEFGSMAQAFQRLADALECVGAIEAQNVLSPRVFEEGLDYLRQAIGVTGKDGKLTAPVPRSLMLAARTAMAQALMIKGRPNEALIGFDEVIREVRDSSEPLEKQAFVISLLGKISALTVLGRITEAIDIAEYILAYNENIEDPAFRDSSVSTALLALANFLIPVAKQALQSGEQAKASALLERAESKFSMWHQRFPQSASLFGYTAYAGFLAGRQNESRALLIQAIGLGGAKLRNALLTLVAMHPLPQDDEFRALLASIPDPPAGSAPSA